MSFAFRSEIPHHSPFSSKIRLFPDRSSCVRSTLTLPGSSCGSAAAGSSQISVGVPDVVSVGVYGVISIGASGVISVVVRGMNHQGNPALCDDLV